MHNPSIGRRDDRRNINLEKKHEPGLEIDRSFFVNGTKHIENSGKYRKDATQSDRTKMDTIIDIHYIFRKLVSFFAANASLQVAVIADTKEDRFYDLAGGHLWTRYPVQVMISQLILYTGGLLDNADSEGFEYVDKDLCAEIIELAEAIVCVYAKDVNSKKDFWSVTSLQNRKIWNSLRRVCMAYSEHIPATQTLSAGDKVIYANLLHY